MLYPQNVFIGDWKFKLNWGSCILSGNRSLEEPREVSRKASRRRGQWWWKDSGAAALSFPSPTHMCPCAVANAPD